MSPKMDQSGAPLFHDHIYLNIFSSVFSRDLGPVPFFISGLMLALMKAAKSGQWEDVDQVDSLLSMEALQLEL